MDIITKAELNDLMENRGDVSLSIFMPTERSGDTHQGRIRLKNLIRQADQELKEKNIDEQRINKLLQPMRDLLDHGKIWKYMNDGLAIYRTDERFDLYRLPVSFAEQVVVNDRFYIKPLLPMFTNNGYFYVLALSKKEIRLLKGTRHTVDQIEIEDKIPESLTSILKEVEFPGGFQFHTGSRRAGSLRQAIFHGHGDEFDEKVQIKSYLREVDRGISDILKGEQLPIVLAGVDELRSLYKEVNSYPVIMEEGVSGSPDRISNQEIHKSAWSVVEPHFEAELNRELSEFKELSGTGKTTNDIKEAISEVIQGRIKTLFISSEDIIYGWYDEHGNVELGNNREQAETEDLIDSLTVKALSSGSTVYSIDKKDIPNGGQLAAVFRF